jgi:hypothetical protein
MLTKTQRFHHSITENGTLQLRIVESIVDGAEIVAETYSDPMTPEDPKNMVDWDKTSRDLVSAVAALSIKKQLVDDRKHPDELTGVGLEESMSYDFVYLEDGRFQVRRIHRIFEEGKELKKTFHRTWVTPGDDPDVLPEPMKSVAKAMHTTKVKDAFLATIQKQREEKFAI